MWGLWWGDWVWVLPAGQGLGPIVELDRGYPYEVVVVVVVNSVKNVEVGLGVEARRGKGRGKGGVMMSRG